jgi:hypothetical protein
LAAAQSGLGDPAALATYRRALNQARTAGDATGEANAALGLGQLLLQQGARVEGGQMLQEAAAAARRMGPRGVTLARRADDLLANMGPLEVSRPPIERPSRRREPATERETRPEAATAAADAETTPADSPQSPSRDAVYRETTLPPL